METSRTNINSREGGLVGHAFVCLGHHMATHRLPHPHDVLVDHDPLTITVALRRGTWQAWLDTVVLDAEENEWRDDALLGTYLVTRWKVRLDNGLQITLRAPREVPLTAVSA